MMRAERVFTRAISGPEHITRRKDRMNLKRSIARGVALGGSIIFASALPAEIDPHKGEGEDAKKARPELDRGEGEGHEEYHRRLAMEGEETLKEINRLLDEIQKNLAGKKTDAATQAKQKAAVERMDELIKALSKGCSQCNSSGSSGSKEQQASESPQKSQDEKQQSEEERRRKEREKMQAQQMKPESEKEKKDGRAENERVADRKPPEAKSGKLTDQLRERARWGLLPPKLAEEMLLSTGKEAPPEYREIISRYYRRMTEQYLKSK
jgi:hypothetical protein